MKNEMNDFKKIHLLIILDTKFPSSYSYLQVTKVIENVKIMAFNKKKICDKKCEKK